VLLDPRARLAARGAGGKQLRGGGAARVARGGGGLSDVIRSQKQLLQSPLQLSFTTATATAVAFVASSPAAAAASTAAAGGRQGVQAPAQRRLQAGSSRREQHVEFAICLQGWVGQEGGGSGDG
jgi:hypothetical protein